MPVGYRPVMITSLERDRKPIVCVYHLESRWLATPMYWLIMAPYRLTGYQSTLWELCHLLSRWYTFLYEFKNQGRGIYICMMMIFIVL